MSTGAEHAKASVTAAIALVPIIGLPFGLPAAVCAAGGSLLGIALSPDLDQETLNSFEHKLVKYTLGLGFLWVMIWYPYSRFLPHRSWLSHVPIIGTCLRLAYLGTVATLGLFAFRVWPSAVVTIPPELASGLTWMVLGLLVSDSIHWVMDGCPMPRSRKSVRRRTKGRGSSK